MRDRAETPLPIRARDLSYHYGKKPALESVAFDLQPGAFLALLGPNGSGKTTLFSLLTRLLVANQGSIELFGQRIDRSASGALRKLGVVFQQPTLDLDLTVAQNLDYHGALQGLSKRKVKLRAAQELERFGLADRAGDRVRTLNGGHRRRVEIARALLHQPQLLLLDEASAGLDFETRHALYNYVRALCREQGLAVLWTTHLIEELALDDETIVLSKGRVVARGSIAQLRSEHGDSDANAALLALTAGAKT